MRAYIYAQTKDKVLAYEVLCKAKQIGSLTQQRYATLERGKIYELLGDYNRAEKEYQRTSGPSARLFSSPISKNGTIGKNPSR